MYGAAPGPVEWKGGTGAAVITDGFQFGGGLGLILGPVHLGFGALYRTGDVGDGIAGSFGLSFGGS